MSRTQASNTASARASSSPPGSKLIGPRPHGYGVNPHHSAEISGEW